MVERKVLSKHLPSGINPRKVPRIALAIKKHKKVRLCAPFTMNCEKCHEFIHKGKKFNARKEHTHQFFMTIEIFRFYIKCTLCSTEIIFATDPENADYTIIKGAKRSAEPHAEEKKQRILKDIRKDFEDDGDSEEDEIDPLAKLEEKTKIQQQEMKDIDDIEALKEQQAQFHKLENQNYAKTEEEELEWFRKQKSGIPDQDALRNIETTTFAIRPQKNNIHLGLDYSDSD
eukprot:NODE_88_length_21789_cov_0.534440.p11 type:complete len:230 gc:universal NODE_88_length_21789_cov_0.534440:18036-18725(+)